MRVKVPSFAPSVLVPALSDLAQAPSVRVRAGRMERVLSRLRGAAV